MSDQSKKTFSEDTLLEAPDGAMYQAPAGMSHEDAYDYVRKQTPGPGLTGAAYSSFADQIPSLMSATGAGVARALGDNQAYKGAVESMQLQDEEAAKRMYGATKWQDIFDDDGVINNMGDAWNFFTEQLGSQAANIAVIGTGAGAGAAAGSLAGPVGATVGGIGGAALASYPLYFGGNVRRNIHEKGAKNVIREDVSDSAMYAVGQAAVDGVLGAMLTPAGKSVVQIGAKGTLSGFGTRMATKIASGAAVGVPIEVTQQMMERASADLDVMTPDAVEEYVDAGIAGGILGGTFGGMSPRVKAQTEIDQIQQNTDSLEVEIDKKTVPTEVAKSTPRDLLEAIDVKLPEVEVKDVDTAKKILLDNGYAQAKVDALVKKNSESTKILATNIRRVKKGFEKLSSPQVKAIAKELSEKPQYSLNKPENVTREDSLVSRGYDRMHVRMLSEGALAALAERKADTYIKSPLQRLLDDEKSGREKAEVERQQALEIIAEKQKELQAQAPPKITQETHDAGVQESLEQMQDYFDPLVRQEEIYESVESEERAMAESYAKANPKEVDKARTRRVRRERDAKKLLKETYPKIGLGSRVNEIDQMNHKELEKAIQDIHLADPVFEAAQARRQRAVENDVWHDMHIPGKIKVRKAQDPQPVTATILDELPFRFQDSNLDIDQIETLNSAVFDPNVTLDTNQLQEFYYGLRNSADYFNDAEVKALNKAAPKLRQELSNITGLSEKDLSNLPFDTEAYMFAHWTVRKKQGKTLNLGDATKPFTALYNSMKDYAKNPPKADTNTKPKTKLETHEQAVDRLRQTLPQRRNEAMVKNLLDNQRDSERLLPADLKSKFDHQNNLGAKTARFMDYLTSFANMARYSPAASVVQQMFQNKNNYAAQLGKEFHHLTKPLVEGPMAKHFDYSNSVLEQMRLSGQDLTMDAEGNLMYQNKEGKSVKINSPEVSKYITEVNEAYKAPVRIKLQELKRIATEIDPVLGENPSAKKIKERVDQLNKDLDAFENDKNSYPARELKRLISTLDRMGESAQQMESISRPQKPYVPFMRYGDYAVVVHDLSRVENGKPAQAYTEFIESNSFNEAEKGQQAEAIKRAQEFAKKDPSRYKVTPVFQLTYQNMRNNMSSRFLTNELFASFFSQGDNKKLDEMHDLTLEDAQLNSEQFMKEQLGKYAAARGFASRFIESDNIPGYSTDWRRNIANYMSSAALGLSNDAYAGRMGQVKAALEASQMEPNLKTAIGRFIDDNSNYQADMPLLRQFNFMATLGFNASTALMQMFTLPTQGAAWLTMISGNPITANATIARNLSKAVAISKSTKGGLFSKADFTYENLVKHIGPERANFISKNSEFFTSSVTQEQLVQRETKDTPAGRSKDFINKSTDLAGGMIAMTERVSRLAMGLSVLDTLKADPSRVEALNKILKDDARWNELRESKSDVDMSDAEKAAIFGIQETHAIFGKEGRGLSQRGLLGSLIMPFMTHPQQMMELLYAQGLKRGPEGRTAAAYTLLAYASMAGIAGIPGVELVKKAFELISALLGYGNKNADHELRELLVKSGMTPDLARTVQKGPLTLTGMDISRRLNMPVFFQEPLMLGIGAMKGETPDARQLLGVPGSYARNVLNFSKDPGNPEQARYLLPTSFRNAYEGTFMYGNTGANTSNGRRLVNPEEFTFTEKAMKAFGLQPLKVSERSQRDFAVRTEKTQHQPYIGRYRERVSRLLEDIGRESDDNNKKRLRRQLQELYATMTTDLTSKGISLDVEFWRGFRRSINNRLKQRRNPELVKANKRVDPEIAKMYKID